MVSAESSYAADVASAKQRIKILKSRLARRAAARQGLAAGKQAGGQAGHGAGEGDEAATAAAEATATLKSLIASHLLSLEATQLPTDNQSIQKKVFIVRLQSGEQTHDRVIHVHNAALQGRQGRRCGSGVGKIRTCQSTTCI